MFFFWSLNFVLLGALSSLLAPFCPGFFFGRLLQLVLLLLLVLLFRIHSGSRYLTLCLSVSSTASWAMQARPWRLSDEPSGPTWLELFRDEPEVEGGAKSVQMCGAHFLL